MHTQPQQLLFLGERVGKKGDRGTLTRRLCWQSLISLLAGSVSSSGSRARKQPAHSWNACRLGEVAGAEESRETQALTVRTRSGQAHMALPTTAGSTH